LHANGCCNELPGIAVRLGLADDDNWQASLKLLNAA
jgi:hypothetical protein